MGGGDGRGGGSIFLMAQAISRPFSEAKIHASTPDLHQLKARHPKRMLVDIKHG